MQQASFGALLAGTALALLLTGATASAAEFYISPHGDDASPGTKDRSFRTLERARDAVRASKDRGRVPVTVWLKAGRYHRATTFALNRRDSGTSRAPVIYRAVHGEEVYIDGGKTIPADACEPVTDGKVLARFVPEAKDRILQIDLKRHGVAEYGKFGPRGFARPEFPAPAELFINGRPQRAARWPNDRRIPMGKVIDKGSVPRSGDKSHRGGVFQYDTPRAERWTQAQHLYISGIFAESWADDTLEVAKVDIGRGTIATLGPHVYGFKNRPFTTWYAVNLLEEIDAPGEYFLDRETGKAYFYPDAPRIEMVQVSQLASPMLKMVNASHVHVRGLVFENSRGVGIRIEGGRSNLVTGCALRFLGGSGVIVKGGFHHVLLSCDVYETGAGGVSLRGGNRKTLTPSGHVVENCDIHRVNRWYRTGKPCVSLSGVGQRASHNHLHHVPGGAIVFYGNEHVMEFNEIDHCVTDMSDMGSVYTGRNQSVMGHVIRHNFFHHLHNKLGSGRGVQAIFIDDDCLYTAIIFGNVFYRAGSNAVIKFNGGGGSSIGNNVAIDCPVLVLGGHTRHVNRTIREMRNPVRYKRLPKRLFKDVDIRKEPFKSRYPYLLDSYENGFNYGTPQWNNLVVESGNPKAMAQFIDPQRMDFTLRPDAPVLKQVAKGVFDRVYGVEHQDMPFRPIPFRKIGRRVGFPRKAPAEPE